MIKIIRNLLPQDTRAVELPSAVGLLLTGLALLFSIIVDQSLLDIHPVEFWILFTFLVGSLQFYALLDFPKLEALRTVICWISGSFWIWVSFNSNIDISALAAFSLGFSNIMAFIINTVLLREKWNSY